MSFSERKESVLIGWGLAGAIMAWQLYLNKKPFSVFDSGINHSTRTAAGLVNPVVFKRLTKSWNADVLMPYAHDFYQQIEQELKLNLLSGRKIFRVFASVEEENNWSSRQGDERFKAYLKTAEVNELPETDVVATPFGAGKVETFGNLNTNLFLDASKDFFLARGVEFIPKEFDYDAYADFEKVNCFFCEGVQVMQNPLFNNLPLKPTHGETLIIKSNQLQFDHILNKNMFVMSIGENLYKVGATYNWELDKPVKTESGRQELEEKLNSFTSFEYEIVEHRAGIRPTISDRRPLLGKHHEKENAFIFNGLGTKGVMIGPYYAEQLMEFVFNQKSLDPEVDISRFRKA